MAFEELTFGTPDVRGLVSDIAVGLVAAGGLLCLARVSRWAAAALAAVWAAIHCGAFEHVRALGVYPDVAHAEFLLQGTFLRGSVARTSAPWALVGTVTLAAGLTLRLRVCTSAWIGGLALLLVLVVTGLSMWPVRFSAMRWRQTNFVADNVRVIAERLGSVDSSSLPAIASPGGAHVGGDLRGTWRLPYEPSGQPNVLLVVLESVSGGHVRQVREHHGLDDVNLPFLDELCRKYAYCPNFVAEQRQTNRGLYALLAGDAPYLTTRTSKMSEYALSPTRTCLPTALVAHGYRTLYLQAAQLDNTVKARFLSLAGFDEVRGDCGSELVGMHNGWGQGDESFFEYVEQRVDELESDPRPWFVTALSVGTHHPYTLVPRYFRTDVRDPQERSFLYADDVLGRFVRRLEQKGTLRNALLVITADESVGLLGEHHDAVLKRVSRNWGLLVVRTPAQDRLVIRAPHVQSDVALSIVDFLGQRGDAAHFGGRSFFREYRAPRTISYGNCYNHTVGVFTPDGELLVFDERLQPRIRARTAPGALFRLEGLEDVEKEDYELGLALAKVGRFSEAEALFQRAADQRPGDFRAHYRLGWTRLQAGRPLGAIEAFDRAVAHWPEYADAHFARGLAQQQAGGLEAALRAFDRTAEIQWDRPGLHFQRGRTLCRMNRHDEALVAYARGLELMPEHAGTHQARAICLLELGRMEEARESRARGAELQPSNARGTPDQEAPGPVLDPVR